MRITRLVAVSLWVGSYLVGCDPGSCQGAIASPLNKQANDNKQPFQKCKGAAIDVQGDVEIRNQIELDGMKGCKRIFGAVIVHDSSDIKDLSSLADLEEINEGYFLAQNNSKLESVEMPSLKKVDYGVSILDNPKVGNVNFDELGNADTEGITKGDITIRDNPVLATVQFPNVQEIRTDDRGGPGSLILGDNPKLTALNGFIKLEVIEGVFQVFNEDALLNFTGMEQLNEIKNTGNAQQALAIGIDFDQAGDIIAAGNDTLSSLAGLNNLELVGDASAKGDVFIGFNPALLNLNGIDDFATFKHDIFIVGNATLNNLSGLEGDGDGNGEDDGLSVVNGSIFVGLFFDHLKQPVAAGNDQLEDLAGLNSLLQLDGSLVLAFNGQLATLDGLDLLPAIGKDLVIVGSRQLDDFQGAQALTNIGGSLVFGQLFSNTDRIVTAGDQDGELEPELDEMGDVNKVPVTDFGCSIDLGNDFVNDDKGFPVLTTITKDLVVAFSDFDTLFLAQNLTSVGGSFILHGSAQPPDLTGLEAVANFGGLVVGMSVDKKGNLADSANAAFESFNGLQINALGAGGLAIGFNQQLDSFATLPTLNNVAGNVTLVAEDVTDLSDVNITAIGGDLNIGAIVNGDDAPINAELANLNDINMNELTSVGGDILVAFEQELDNTTMNALGSVGGSLEITACNNLATVSGLDALGTVGNLLIHDLPALTTLDVSGLGNSTGDIRLVNDENLDTIQLNSLGDVGGTLELRNLPVVNLDTLNGLTNVGDIGNAVGDLALVDLTDLTNTAGFAALQTVGGSFFILRAESIEDTVFPALTTVGGSFELVGLETVVDLEGLEPLASVGDGLRIRDNLNLVTLKGLEGLGTIGRELSIVNNPELDIVFRDEGVQDVLDENGGVIDQGLFVLAQIGDPDFEGVGGDRGVIEAQDNPKMREEDLITVAEDFTAQFEGFFKMCGNEDSGEDPDHPSDLQCP